MKETINISISGISFVIDREAYAKLNDYIEVVKQRFTPQGSEGEEIIADIEARIAEILLSKRQSALEPITMACVDGVISQMGMPEVVEEVSDPMGHDYEKEVTKNDIVPKMKRRLYRNREGATIGGVLNGIASYFAIDVVWLRIAVALLFVISIFTAAAWFGYGVIIYIILWIIVPQAKTALQKLEMEGKNASITNIETTHKNDKSYKYRKEIHRSLGFLGAILKGILVVVVGFLLLVMFVVIVSALVAVAGVFVAREFFEPLVVWNLPLAVISAALTVVIPCVVLATIFIGTLRSKVNIPRAFYVICAILWIVSVVGGGTMWVRNIYELNTKRSTSETIYQSTTIDKLYVRYMPDSMVPATFSDKTLVPFKNTIVQALDDNGIGNEILGIYCHDTYDSTLKVVFTFTARGVDDNEAIEHTKQIIVPHKIVGDTLFISPYFQVEGGKYYNQKVSVDFYVPEGKEVVASDYNKIRFYDGDEDEDSLVSIYSGSGVRNPTSDAEDDNDEKEQSITINASLKMGMDDDKKGKDSTNVERKTIDIEVK